MKLFDLQVAFEFSYCKFEDYHVPAGEYGSTLTDDMRGFFIDAMCPRFLSNLKQAYQNSEMWDIVRHIEKWDGRHSEIQRFRVLVACSFMLLSSTSPTKSVAGIHWNFFFTIAVVSLVSTTTDSWPRIIQILRVSHSVSLSTWMNEWTSRCYRCYQSLPVNSCFGPCFLTHATTPHMFLSAFQKLSLRDFWL